MHPRRVGFLLNRYPFRLSFFVRLPNMHATRFRLSRSGYLISELSFEGFPIPWSKTERGRWGAQR